MSVCVCVLDRSCALCYIFNLSLVLNWWLIWFWNHATQFFFIDDFCCCCCGFFFFRLSTIWLYLFIYSFIAMLCYHNATSSRYKFVLIWFDMFFVQVLLWWWISVPANRAYVIFISELSHICVCDMNVAVTHFKERNRRKSLKI